MPDGGAAADRTRQMVTFSGPGVDRVLTLTCKFDWEAPHWSPFNSQPGARPWLTFGRNGIDGYQLGGQRLGTQKVNQHPGATFKFTTVTQVYSGKIWSSVYPGKV